MHLDIFSCHRPGNVSEKYELLGTMFRASRWSWEVFSIPEIGFAGYQDNNLFNTSDECLEHFRLNAFSSPFEL